MIFYVVLLTVLVFLYTYKKSLSQRFFAKLLDSYTEVYNEAVGDRKRELFDDLAKFDQESRKKHGGKNTKILEIGVGPGANLKFYPSTDLDLSCIDPNPFGEQYLVRNLSKYPNIKLDRFVCGVGEDMSSFSDSSFDAVVMTLVFCSVTDTEKVLNEILRVLRPGGKFYFIEHILDKPGTWRHRLQKFLAPVWCFLLEGCRPDRETGKIIRNSGFSKIDITDFEANLGKYSVVVGSHTYGYAVK